MHFPKFLSDMQIAYLSSDDYSCIMPRRLLFGRLNAGDVNSVFLVYIFTPIPPD